MSTRKTIALDNSPLSQERYMSSPEYAELRGLSGTAVAPRAAIVDNPAIRRLIWFLQARSIESGGLKRVAREVLDQYPDCIGTPSMHKFGMKPGQVYKAEQVRAIRAELPQYLADDFPLRGERWEHLFGEFTEAKAPRPGYETDDSYGSEEFRDQQRAARDFEKSRAYPLAYPVEKILDACRLGPETLAKFLTDICVNPCRLMVRSSERESIRAGYEQRLEQEFPDQRLSAEFAELFWFRDIIGTLMEYQRQQEESARADFVLTAIGAKVWETLDFALKSQRMVVVEGWEGRGKTEAVKAWCLCHQGEARFVNLSGVTSKTAFFRAIAKALGIASSYSRTATEMQARIEDVLQRSKILLVVDEAHFAFPQSQRIYSRPEIVDWIDTALCNHGVPVALITTPQFINCVKRAETQVGWNWRQFRRRVKRWVQLPQRNTEADLETVARKILPGITRAGIKLAVGYTLMSLHGSPSRDISGLGDVALEARLIAEADGRDTITFEDVERAINDYLMPSDSTFAERMATPLKGSGKRRTSPVGDEAETYRAVSEPLKENLKPHSRAIKPAAKGRFSAGEPPLDETDGEEPLRTRAGGLVAV